MSTVAQINAQRKAAGLPLIRFNLVKLQPADIQDLRDAYAQLYAFSDTAPGDNRGYWSVARGHGYDQQLCHNDSRIFLTWHRAYIYAFEKRLTSALQFVRKDPNLQLTLPFWDWTAPWNAFFYAPNGLPKVTNDPTYTNGSGQNVPNPLASARSMYRVQALHFTGADQFTVRYPDQFRAAVPTLASDVASYMTMNDYMRFSNTFDNGAHGTVHVVTGGQNPASKLPNHIGDMGSIISAAYDPIFWLHHAMVDKVWFDWQAKFGNSTVPAHVLTTVVYGGFTGAQVLDTAGSLKYIYSNQPPSSAKVAGATVHLVAKAAAEKKDDAPVAKGPQTGVNTFNLGAVNGDLKEAHLEFHSLHPPKDSYEIRAYLNYPDANETTGREHPAYAGRLTLFGHGHCFAGQGHCDPDAETRDDYDLRPKHPLRYQKTNYTIDLTQAVKVLLKGHTEAQAEAAVTLVTIGADGKQVAPSTVVYSGVSLITASPFTRE